MGWMKKLTMLEVGDKIAVNDRENSITYVGKIVDILDYWDGDVYHVEYNDSNDTIQNTTVNSGDIDLVKQKELYLEG